MGWCCLSYTFFIYTRFSMYLLLRPEEPELRSIAVSHNTNAPQTEIFVHHYSHSKPISLF